MRESFHSIRRSRSLGVAEDKKEGKCRRDSARKEFWIHARDGRIAARRRKRELCESEIGGNSIYRGSLRPSFNTSERTSASIVRTNRSDFLKNILKSDDHESQQWIRIDRYGIGGSTRGTSGDGESLRRSRCSRHRQPREMWSETRFLVLGSLALLVGAQVSDGSQRPRLAGAVNIFSRYGYLSISMRVVPRNDTDTWIFREPTLDVFRNPVAAASRPRQQTAVLFDGDFHMEFCDNIRQLLQAYFRDFTFERLERPWRAFTGSWSKAAIARHLGINSSFITGEHCYVLVRVARFRENQKLSGTAESMILDEAVLRETENVTVGDTASVVRFIKNFGSHYITAFVTGNSLYQVFVYTPQAYLRIKERLKTRGVADLSNLELSNYFSPWYAEHMGSIQAASGNRTVEAWAVERLRNQYYIFSYASLLKLHGDATLLKQLDGLLGNEALLQLQLRTLAPIFKDPQRREWFLEVIDNYFKLWEVNM